MWRQSVNPFHSIILSALVAAIPIAVLFILLISRRVAGHIAAVCTLFTALAVAILAYHMPFRLALLSAGYGALNGIWPIAWIVVTAVFLYNLSVRSGGFKIVCSSIESITSDRRLQSILIAFCFGAFLEGCAGFGAPVAITTGMLVGLGFDPLYAAGICLIANSAPVAFGSIGIPIVTAAQTSGVDAAQLGRAVANQLPILSFIIPLWLVILVAGWKGAREVWPAILVTSVSYTLTMYLVAIYLGPLLPNILSAIVSLVCLVLFLRFWKPAAIWRFPDDGKSAVEVDVAKYSPAQRLRALTPYVLLVLMVSNWGVPGVKAVLDQAIIKLPVSGLNDAILLGSKPIAAVYSFGWLSAAGTAILFAALFTIILQRIPIRVTIQALGDTLSTLRNPLITITSIVGFAYLSNFSGISLTLGIALTATGHFFPLISPIVGWVGVFVTGSDTSSNALFSNLQQATAKHLGINPMLTIAANTDGGVCAKMISPQSIAVAAASSKLVGKEGRMFRTALPHSLGMLAIMCLLTFLQAHSLRAMMPEFTEAAAIVPSSVRAVGDFGTVMLCLSAFALVCLVAVNSKRAASLE